MKWNMETAELFIPDGLPEAEALGRTTHLGVGAHQDDLEFMALHGILECYRRPDRWFGGVTMTNGAGSPRGGEYAAFTDEQMRAVRRVEQQLAARIGQYAFVAQLDYPSSAIKNAADPKPVEDLAALLAATRPEVVYTHNPADKHDTHVAVMGATIRAIRALPPGERPARVLGCEVWTDLDWMPDTEKAVLDVARHENLAAALNGVYDSQIAGGKRYDLAVMGRRRAHATFLQSHATDDLEQATFAMDLTPLVRDDDLDVAAYTRGLIDRFKEEVTDRLKSMLG